MSVLKVRLADCDKTWVMWSLLTLNKTYTYQPDSCK